MYIKYLVITVDDIPWENKQTRYKVWYVCSSGEVFIIFICGTVTWRRCWLFVFTLQAFAVVLGSGKVDHYANIVPNETNLK